MHRLSLSQLVSALCLCLSVSVYAYGSRTESISFQPELQIRENAITHVMPFEDRNALRVWTSALPAGKEKKFFAKGEYGLTQFDTLTFQISLSENESSYSNRKYELIAYFKDVDFWWYQKLLPYELRSGDTSEIVVPLDDGPDIFDSKYRWKPVGHMKPLDRSAFRKLAQLALALRSTAFRKLAFSRLDLRKLASSRLAPFRLALLRSVSDKLTLLKSRSLRSRLFKSEPLKSARSPRLRCLLTNFFIFLCDHLSGIGWPDFLP